MIYQPSSMRVFSRVAIPTSSDMAYYRQERRYEAAMRDTDRELSRLGLSVPMTLAGGRGTIRTYLLLTLIGTAMYGLIKIVTGV